MLRIERHRGRLRSIAVTAMALGIQFASAHVWAGPPNSDESYPIKSDRPGGPRWLAIRSTSATARVYTGGSSPIVPLSVATAFGITSPGAQLARTSSTHDSLGQTHVTLQQLHLGVPVFSGILKLHLAADGTPLLANGRFYQLKNNMSVKPALSAADASAMALDQFAGTEPEVIRTELVIVDPGWYGDPPIGAHLAYYVIVTDQSQVRDEAFFIDAASGDVLDRWPMVCSLVDREVHDAQGSTALPGVLARSEGQPPVGDPDIDRLYDYLGDAYTYYQLAFGRDSYDDAGSPIVASAHYDALNCPTNPNAFWSFTFQRIAFCGATTVDDVVAHEFTHGVTQFTGNMIYQNQPGQLNESFSDIFGEMVDQFNSDSAFAGTTGSTPWVPHPSGPGNDSPNNHRTNSCSTRNLGFPDGVRWVIAEDSPAWSVGLRDMWQPTCFNHPDRANSPLESCSPLDQGGVHSGSGVLNHAFAIVCDGTTFNGETVSGIGPIKAGAIWYRALSTYLTVASDFDDAYVAINRAATDLIGTTPADPRNGLPSASAITGSDAAEVNKALLAVELNTPGSCGQSTPVLDSSPPPTCAEPVVIFADDFESGAPGWSVSNTATTAPYDWVITDGLPFDRPGHAWFCADANVGSCDGDGGGAEAVHSLVSPPFVIPAAFPTLTLEFTHFMESEPRFDGGIVSLRINGGDWTQIPTAAFIRNRYNTSLFTAGQDNTNPLSGSVSFSGVGGKWGVSLVDLAALASEGDVVELRFDFSKDSCFGFTGWFIDDLRVYGCASSGDCNGNGVPDEMETLFGGPAIFIDQVANNSSGNLSDADPHPTLGVNKLADDFIMLRPGRIDRVKVWGGYLGDTPVPDIMTVNFYESAAGVPGSLVAARPAVASTRFGTGRVFNHMSEYEYTLTISPPVNLPVGVYFAEIFNDTTGAVTTWDWERAFYGWQPGCARVGQNCSTYCHDSLFNFSLRLFGAFDSPSRGDANLDGSVNTADIPAFIDRLLIAPSHANADCASDINSNGNVDGADIPAFVECVLAGGC